MDLRATAIRFKLRGKISRRFSYNSKQTTECEILKVLFLSLSSTVSALQLWGRCLCFCFSISSATPLMLAIPGRNICFFPVELSFPEYRTPPRHAGTHIFTDEGKGKLYFYRLSMCTACELYSNTYRKKRLSNMHVHNSVHANIHKRSLSKSSGASHPDVLEAEMEGRQ